VIKDVVIVRRGYPDKSTFSHLPQVIESGIKIVAFRPENPK